MSPISDLPYIHLWVLKYKIEILSPRKVFKERQRTIYKKSLDYGLHNEDLFAL